MDITIPVEGGYSVRCYEEGAATPPTYARMRPTRTNSRAYIYASDGTMVGEVHGQQDNEVGLRDLLTRMAIDIRE